MLKRLFKDRFFNRKLVTLAMPITLQNLMVALVAAADAFMLGKLNQDAIVHVGDRFALRLFRRLLFPSSGAGNLRMHLS